MNIDNLYTKALNQEFLTVDEGLFLYENAPTTDLMFIGNELRKIYDRLEEENINIAHYDMRFVKPIDEELLHKTFKKFNKIITLEDGAVVGGFGSAVLEFMNKNNYTAKIKRLGIPDNFIEHGTQQELYKECGYDAESIYQEIKRIL